ncbi:hypothetical protein PLICRDRAFT_144823 [Plicaturopsis crispa FD-325 SS-3]|nr:hypothetical protein PLICRDRAFT_144823 [Plicaturopsis crispa FD-325 SS-3]
MSDGSRLRDSWYEALNGAEAHFRKLLTSPAAEWKRVAVTTNTEPSSPSNKGKARAVAEPGLSDIVVHRRSGKSGDNIFRVVLDFPTGDEPVSLEAWKSVLATPELRQDWDPAVEEAHLVEMFDTSTRIFKTNYTLGWPANPRDAVTISRSFHDPTTVIDISTSLPRSADEPAYLRPSPPYVRSHVTLFAWCVQHIQPQPGSETQKRKNTSGRLRVTCFWQHDFRAVWNFGSSAAVSQQLCTMVLGLFKTVAQRGTHVPMLTGYGNGVTIERVRFQVDRAALTVDYAIIPDDDEQPNHPPENMHGLDELHAIREQRRLTRAIECALPFPEGWDVQISTKASSSHVEQLPWSTQAIRSSSAPSPTSAKTSEKIIFRVTHSPLTDNHSVLKVKLIVELSGPSSGLRLNGISQTIQDIEDRDPSSYFITQPILQDVSSTAEQSFHTVSSTNTVDSATSGTSRLSAPHPGIIGPNSERSAAAEKSILSRVRRSYIYFSSLLQEPEAKWKRTTENRGVSITQLDSIDPTLVVYRAEATFVGVGLWDLYGALVSPGARIFWDKQHEDGVLLEDVNELTELWHFKTRPAWPVNGRDAVVLKTVYKSPTTIHVFSFSADDPHLFPTIPPVEPNVIRTQIDLQGWAIEALSPTTTLLTLLEQSDPKGWSNKASIPQQMINALAGVGEFAIKCGGPPAVTRLAGAKANQIRYDHERGNFRIEYEGSASRRTLAENALAKGEETAAQAPLIECEIRCDFDTWASSLDIVIDPPPQSISALRRHRLSAGGGGLWLTVNHDAMFTGDERILTIVRRGPSSTKEKGLVMVNGAKVTVDTEDLSEHEIKVLTKRKRTKPIRIPLDQPPVMGVIRRRRAEWDAAGSSSGSTPTSENGPSSGASPGWAAAPRFPSPLARWFTIAADTTQQAVAAISPAAPSGDDFALSSSKAPMQYALEALAWTQDCHSRTSTGWTVITDKGMSVQQRLAPEISPVVPVHKGDKVIEGVSAEELASVITSYGCRRQWDDRFDSCCTLEGFGAESHTSFLVSKGGFPFRDRGFYLASVMARGHVAPPLSRRNTGEQDAFSVDSRNVIFCVSASFSPDSVSSFSTAAYNSYGLPIGRVFVDAWILETLDPYTTEKYAIPSARCTRLVAVDYAGSVPAAVNSMINATLPRAILAVEAYVKNISPLPISRLPAAGVVIADKKSDELVASSPSWKLRRRDDKRILITTHYFPDERAYHSALLLTLPAPDNRQSEEATPRPSRITLQRPGSPSDPVQHVRSETMYSSSSMPALSARSRASSESTSVPSRENSALRSSSSAFTLKGEVRPFTDLLVAELVVDTKLYPAGYQVQASSRIRDSLLRVPLAKPSKGETASPPSRVLPLAYAVHTMPSSPLHSSGLNADRPPRHLLRITLPTAQYQISTVQDPLTGETRSAPPKPQWLVDLEEKGAIVDIDIRPSSTESKRTNGGVLIDGAEVTVVSEKESLTKLGRDELQDDRISKMPVLARIANEAETLPDELTVPLAIADYLLDPTAAPAPTKAGQDTKELEEISEGGDEPQGPQPAEQKLPVPPPAPPASSNGLLSFLNSYPNPLSRFTSSSPRTQSPVPSPPHRSPAGPRVPGGLPDLDGRWNSSAVTAPSYTLSTVIVVALIAFLIGSLLRSLLSPADFIYVVSDLQEAEAVDAGWREIKRLLEVKYLVGGWDFQVAVVRRH